MKQLRIATVDGAEEVADEVGHYRFFEIDGSATAGEIASGLGCPGMTLAIDDVELEADHVFGANEELDLFSEAGDAPAFRVVPITSPR